MFRNLLAHPVRTVLTGGSVLLAVFLLCFLRATVTALTSSVEQASTQRLWVQSAVSLLVDLPLAYESKIKQVDGIEWVCKWQWFGGYYKEESNFFAQFGVDPETMLKSYPEMEIVSGSYEEFAKSRTGCMIGLDLQRRYGFKVGDRVPIVGKIFPRKDGSPWEFEVKAVYRTTSAAIDQGTLYFPFDYLRESIEGGSAWGDVGIGVFLVKLRPGADPTRVAAAIDLLFDRGPQRVQTTTEAEFSRQFVSMMGNVPLLLQSIGGAVLFAIFFAVLNTMLMAGRERTRDIGVMKALGFTDGVVFRSLLGESLLLCLLGGGAGAGLAKLVEAGLQRVMSAQFPGFAIDAATVGVGLGAALVIGTLAGLGPGWRARGLTPVAALREGI